MGLDGLVVLVVDRTDVKVGFQCFENSLYPPDDIIIFTYLLFVAALEAGLDDVFALTVAAECRLLRVARPGHARGRVLVVTCEADVVVALHGRATLLQPAQPFVDAVTPLGTAFAPDAFHDGTQTVLKTARSLVAHAPLLEGLGMTVYQQQRVVDILYFGKPDFNGLVPDVLDGHRTLAHDPVGCDGSATADSDVVVAVLTEPSEVRLNGDAGVHDDYFLFPVRGWRGQQRHDVPHCGAIGRVAGKDLRAHKEAVLVDHSTKNDDGTVRPLLLAAAKLAELRPSGRLHVSVGEVEQVHQVVKAEHVADAFVEIVLHAVVERTKVECTLVKLVLGDGFRGNVKKFAQGGVLAQIADRFVLRTRLMARAAI